MTRKEYLMQLKTLTGMEANLLGLKEYMGWAIGTLLYCEGRLFGVVIEPDDVTGMTSPYTGGIPVEIFDGRIGWEKVGTRVEIPNSRFWCRDPDGLLYTPNSYGALH